MTITIESTTKISKLNGIDCRLWEGKTDSGIAIHAFIPLVAVRESENQEQFQAELSSQRAPSPEVEAIPLRMIL